MRDRNDDISEKNRTEWNAENENEIDDSYHELNLLYG